ncbi:VTC domain-containing protein [Streptomyces caatingaensis]|uniref:VTC domain-containing protein n=1 Tax=Streptomyces caatingaensis TaxID=1678637 RepID=UPI000AAE7313
MSTSALEALTGAVGAAAPVTLAALNERSELLVRFDRSYLVPTETFLRIAEQLTAPGCPGGPFRALEIGGRRVFRYRSVYYDTPGLRSFHDHRQGRRVRFKIRERVYEDSGERQFEIKVKGRRGSTVKHRRRLAGSERVLEGECGRFLADTLRHSCGLGTPDGLKPSLRTDYTRATLVAAGQRVTCDAGLSCVEPDTGRIVRCDPGLVLVETKTAGRLSDTDRMLHAQGLRPAVFTKYCGGLAALRPDLTANRWRRATRRVFPSGESVRSGESGGGPGRRRCLSPSAGQVPGLPPGSATPATGRPVPPERASPRSHRRAGR